MKERLGWHNRGYIPHFDGYGAAQHVVFRTSDSLTPSIVKQSLSMSVETARRWLDDHLDNSESGRIFSNEEASKVMQDTMRFFDGDRFDLLAWCIMPNHIHALIVPLKHHRLGDIVRTWKMRGTKELGGGKVFAADYFDRFIRNSKHMATTQSYIEFNPVKAGLCRHPEDWPWSSASEKAKGWLPNAKNCPVFLS